MESSNYIIHDKLGDGGYACVYLAQHKDSEDLVALKVFNDVAMFDKAQQEYTNCNKMNHPNIVKVSGVSKEQLEIEGVTKEAAFMVMEYIKNGMLYDFLEKCEETKKADGTGNLPIVFTEELSRNLFR